MLVSRLPHDWAALAPQAPGARYNRAPTPIPGKSNREARQ